MPSIGSQSSPSLHPNRQAPTAAVLLSSHRRDPSNNQKVSQSQDFAHTHARHDDGHYSTPSSCKRALIPDARPSFYPPSPRSAIDVCTFLHTAAVYHPNKNRCGSRLAPWAWRSSWGWPPRARARVRKATGQWIKGNRCIRWSYGGFD